MVTKIYSLIIGRNIILIFLNYFILYINCQVLIASKILVNQLKENWAKADIEMVTQ